MNSNETRFVVPAAKVELNRHNLQNNEMVPFLQTCERVKQFANSESKRHTAVVNEANKKRVQKGQSWALMSERQVFMSLWDSHDCLGSANSCKFENVPVGFLFVAAVKSVTNGT